MRWRNSAIALVAIALTAGRAAPQISPKPAAKTAAPGQDSGRAATARQRLATLKRDIDALLASPSLNHATVGVVVRSLRTNQPLYSLNPHKLLMPASTMKIVTVAAAADRLGWDYTYTT